MKKKILLVLTVGALAVGTVGALRIRATRSVMRELAIEEAAESKPRVPKPLKIALPIYDSKLNTGWENWSRTALELNNSGPAKVVFANYRGLVFKHTELSGPYGGLVFRYLAPASWGEFLSVSLRKAGSRAELLPEVKVTPAHVAAVGDGWREVLIDWRELNPVNASFDRVAITGRTAVPDSWVLFDKLALVAPSGDEAARLAVKQREDLGIFCSRPARRINPLIYGGANADASSGITARRIGGNPLTRFNWEQGFWNRGSDWYFENAKVQTITELLDDPASANLTTTLVVPIIGWVAKDGSSVGFPTDKLGKQRATDPYRSEAGDGYRPDGTKLPPGPPTETSIAAPPELISRWIKSLRERDRKAGRRSVSTYILDNEPSLWDQTHRDVHPEPTGYDELLDRTLRYASEIRKADPEGLIAGPAEWGWTGYFFSGKDRAAGTTARPDRRAHRGTPLVPWYLAELAKYEAKNGTRLLDVLDLHYYPQAPGIYGAEEKIDSLGRALRIRSTRSLWDSSYEDESWIKEPINLIPRLKEWVTAYYPGLLTSIGEWNFGGENDISGAIATAEALGRFGQFGLDSAYFWNGPRLNTQPYWAFRAFRNFDGAGGRFLDWSVPTREAENVSVFASRDDARSHFVAVLLNRHADVTATARIELESCERVHTMRSFRYDASGAHIVPDAETTFDSHRIAADLPPYSITILDIWFRQPDAQ